MAKTMLDSLQVTDTTFSGSMTSGAEEFDREFGPMVFYVDYTKGDESEVRMKVQISLEDSPAEEDWFDAYSAEGNDLSSLALYMNATGRYRVNWTEKDVNGLPGGPMVGEDRLRVSVKRTDGTAGGAGTVTVKVASP